MEPKTNQNVRLMPKGEVWAEHWLTGSVHFSPLDNTADFYLSPIAPSVAEQLCEYPDEWSLFWRGLRFDIKTALRYPCTDDIVVVVVPMTVEQYDPALLVADAAPPKMCAATQPAALAYDPLTGITDHDPPYDAVIL